jgi:hypothetical protein
MKSDTLPDVAEGQPAVLNTPAEPAGAKADDAIALESCSALEWIAVRTRHSVYDLIVLGGGSGDVMVRGGLFPDFRHATVAGSTCGGIAVKLRTICVGCHLELYVDGESVITSRIESVSRDRLRIAREPAQTF